MPTLLIWQRRSAQVALSLRERIAPHPVWLLLLLFLSPAAAQAQTPLARVNFNYFGENTAGAGQEDKGSLTVVVSLSNSPPADAAVQWTLSDGTAKGGTDYKGAGGTLTFTKGTTQLSQTITIETLNNGSADGIRYGWIELSNPTGCTLDMIQNKGKFFIYDDDAPITASFGSGTYSIGEKGSKVDVQLKLSAACPNTVKVEWTSAGEGDNPAKSPQHYYPASGYVEFKPGDTSKTVSINILDNSNSDGDKKATLSITNVLYGPSVGSPSSSTLTIQDDEPPPPNVQFASASFSAKETDGTATITVNLSAAAQLPISVNYKVEEGTAKNTKNFTATTGMLSFAKGESSKTFTVMLMYQAALDGDLTVNLSLNTPTNAKLGTPSTAVLTLTEVAPPTVQFAAAKHTVGEKGSSVNLEVSLSAPALDTVMVQWSGAPVDPNPAQSPADYGMNLGTLTFAKGDQKKNISLTIYDNAKIDGNRKARFTVAVTSGSAYLGETVETVLTILDDDLPPLGPILAEVAAPSSPKENDAATVTGKVFHPSAVEFLTLEVDWGTGDKDTQSLTTEDGVAVFNLSRQYLDDAKPTLTVKATDSQSYSDSETLNLTVSNVAPVVVDLSLSLVDETGTTTLTGEFTDPGTLDTHKLTVTWGDSSSPQTVDLDPLGVRTFTLTHQYQGTEPLGGFLVSVTVQDKDKATGGGSVKQPKVLIWADLDRDGAIDEKKDHVGKENKGTVLIADKDGVYADATAPARRREIKATTNIADQKTAIVKRSSNNLLLYDADKGGKELFGMKDEATISLNTSYWLHAGANPSTAPLDHSLAVRQDKVGSMTEDQVKVTVIWTEIQGVNKNEIKPAPVGEYAKFVQNVNGHKNLGVHRCAPGGSRGERKASGNIEIRAQIFPATVFAGVLSEGFAWENELDKDGKETGQLKAKAKNGFVFKRKVSFKDYLNGEYTPTSSTVDRHDDSMGYWQDVNPDQDEKNLLIIDFDGPNVEVVPGIVSFAHSRNNFVEHLVFHWDPKGSERTSAFLKWAFSADAGFGPGKDGKLLFIRAKPNTTETFNALLVGKHLPSLDMDLPLPVITEAHADNKDKTRELKRNEDNLVVITGENLIGRVVLRKTGQVDIDAKEVRLKEIPRTKMDEPPMGDVNYVYATINPVATGSGWELILINGKGKSNPIGGFKLVD